MTIRTFIASAKSIIFLLLILCANSLIGQNRTWLNYETGISVNSNNWNTQLANSEIRKGLESGVGLYIEQEINKYLSIEIGVNDKFYGFDINIYENENIKLISSYAQFVQIPLRVKGRVNLFKKRVFIIPNIGLAYTVNAYDGILIIPDEYEYEVKSYFPKDIIFFQSGLNIEFIQNSWRIGLFVSYSHYGKDLIEYSVPELETKFYSNGNYTTYQIRAGYAISDIWNKIIPKIKEKRNKREIKK